MGADVLFIKANAGLIAIKERAGPPLKELERKLRKGNCAKAAAKQQLAFLLSCFAAFQRREPLRGSRFQHVKQGPQFPSGTELCEALSLCAPKGRDARLRGAELWPFCTLRAGLFMRFGKLRSKKQSELEVRRRAAMRAYGVRSYGRNTVRRRRLPNSFVCWSAEFP
uniref:Uncharacterized protein n=1 Tax=Caulerpa lentillifera TaxID=148947 RepID=A0A2Z2QKZ6_9CHLO|nr:hypothetical protein [Caulerpa lentillifera]AST24271.1 hypothetical protein [Caulerpa lentillifera]